MRTVFEMTNIEKQETTERNIKLGVIYSPSKSQINTLAKRFIPEIKKYFADEDVLQEFAEWQNRQNPT